MSNLSSVFCFKSSSGVTILTSQFLTFDSLNTFQAQYKNLNLQMFYRL